LPNSQSEPSWPAPGELIDLNQRLVADTGEPHGVLKPAELDAACAHPINQWCYGGERDLLRLAVGLMIAVARSHPFVQGNKRTAFAAGQLLLVSQGLILDFPDDASSAELIRLAMIGELSEAFLLDRYAANLRAIRDISGLDLD
jgi:death-on-curing protein